MKELKYMSGVAYDSWSNMLTIVGYVDDPVKREQADDELNRLFNEAHK